MMRIAIYLASSEPNSGIAKPKLEELPLIFWMLFENSYTVDTQQKIERIKNCHFCEKVKLVTV